ncbi:unnamed protein product [Porites evermanni]|uniref:alpha-1,6-mannosyl-glycoprotein 6-beta-N-acetylglucosaminyltransferase n=1 Tax=Porites evermanni TaxID=104178 RepID=A0ABN8PZT0_9CNID|nr:unnamed protein product [Porites evermanni]
MSFGSVRSVICTLLVLAGLWILFLVAAHLILDIEQGRKYFEGLKLVKFGGGENKRESLRLQEELYLEKIEGEDEVDCEIPEDKSYPDCENRVELLRNNWQKNPCYMEYGVDGRTCSLVIYLSEVESWCPRLTWRKYMKKAVLQNNSDKLLSKLNSIPGSQPIRSRISSMWSYWQDSLHFMRSKDNIDMRSEKKILLFIGLLMDAPKNQTKLTDELLQWSDLLASLYVLGHDVNVKTDRVELLSLLTEGSQFAHRGCEKGDSGFDLVYIDLPGLQQLVTSAPDPGTLSLVWSKYSCRLRVLAPFGMDAEFNCRDYTGPIMGERSHQGNWNLNLKQFLTKYPLSVDNSFLGFAVKHPQNETVPKKTSMAFAVGGVKQFSAHKHFLRAIYKYIRIHAAVSAEEGKMDLPFIINHGNINSTAKGQLLQRSKLKSLLIERSCLEPINVANLFVKQEALGLEIKQNVKLPAFFCTVANLKNRFQLLIGLGSPYEEALALEAISNGCIFINPKFKRPKNRINCKALKDLPSSRNLSSQHPYLEKFVGKPFVYTVDIWNKTEATQTLQEILTKKVISYVPFEFTCEGMLERLNAYIENQNFCDKSYHWPVQNDELNITMARAGTSCTEACFKEGLTCEPEYFHLLNSSSVPSCTEVVSEESVTAPATEESTSRCVYQKQPLLYSCTGHDPNYRRFCPCRHYREGQIALCRSCF